MNYSFKKFGFCENKANLREKYGFKWKKDKRMNLGGGMPVCSGDLAELATPINLTCALTTLCIKQALSPKPLLKVLSCDHAIISNIYVFPLKQPIESTK